MNILQIFKKLRDDIKTWATNNLKALDEKIDKKTFPIDNSLSSTSTNPVQNKMVTNAINNIPRFSGAYNDLTNAPSIEEDGSDTLTIADNVGNIILKVDPNGMSTTKINVQNDILLNGEQVATKNYVTNITINNSEEVKNAIEETVYKEINNLKDSMGQEIASEDKELSITDEQGNIILRINSNGVATTEVNANDLKINSISVNTIMDTKIAD